MIKMWFESLKKKLSKGHYGKFTSKKGPSCRARKRIQNHITEPKVVANNTVDLEGLAKNSGLLNFSENMVMSKYVNELWLVGSLK